MREATSPSVRVCGNCQLYDGRRCAVNQSAVSDLCLSCFRFDFVDRGFSLPAVGPFYVDYEEIKRIVKQDEERSNRIRKERENEKRTVSA